MHVFDIGWPIYMHFYYLMHFISVKLHAMNANGVKLMTQKIHVCIKWNWVFTCYKTDQRRSHENCTKGTDAIFKNLTLWHKPIAINVFQQFGNISESIIIPVEMLFFCIDCHWHRRSGFMCTKLSMSLDGWTKTKTQHKNYGLIMQQSIKMTEYSVY